MADEHLNANKAPRATSKSILDYVQSWLELSNTSWFESRPVQLFCGELSRRMGADGKDPQEYWGEVMGIVAELETGKDAEGGSSTLSQELCNHGSDKSTVMVYYIVGQTLGRHAFDPVFGEAFRQFEHESAEQQAIFPAIESA